MSETTQADAAPQNGTTEVPDCAMGPFRADLDVLTPSLSRFSRIGVALLVVSLALGAWFVPPMLHLRVEPNAPAAVVSPDSPVGLVYAPLDVPIGGATITGIAPIDGARLVGAWVVSARDRAALTSAADGWSLRCGGGDSAAAECRLPAGDGQAEALLAALVRRGAPLGADDALPRRIPGGAGATVVTLWQVTRCDATQNAGVTVRARTIAGAFDLPLWLGLPVCP